jgi:hypothetical protein
MLSCSENENWVSLLARILNTAEATRCTTGAGVSRSFAASGPQARPRRLYRLVMTGWIDEMCQVCGCVGLRRPISVRELSWPCAGARGEESAS